MAVFLYFVLYLLIGCGILAGCYLFYKFCLHLIQRRMDQFYPFP